MPFDSTNYEKPTPAEVETVDEVGAIILRARDLLSDPAKWAKGSPRKCEDGSYKYCIIGAVFEACGGDWTGSNPYSDTYIGATTRIAQVISPQGAVYPPSTITTYNDAGSRTHADVLALLDRAALSKSLPQSERA